MDDRKVGRGPTARRAVAVLATAALASSALAITPAFSAKPVKKKYVKAALTTLGGKLFIEEGTELVRYTIKLGVGQTAPVGTFGPFTLTAECAQGDFSMDGPPFENRGRILIDTSEDNSSFDSNEEDESDFDAADPPEEWVENYVDVGTQSINSENDEKAHATAPSGTSIASEGNIVAVNFAGADCVLAGGILTNA